MDRLPCRTREARLTPGAMVLCLLLCALAPPPAFPDAGPDAQGAASAADAPIAVQRVLYKTQIYMSRNRHGEALNLIRGYLAKNPQANHCLLEFSLGNILYVQGKAEESIEHFQAATRLDPGYGPAWINLGQAAFDQKRYALAGEALSRGYAASENKNPEYLHYAAVAYIMGQSYDRAVPILELLVADKNTQPRKEWFNCLLEAYMALNRKADAERLVNRMLDLHGADPETWRLACRFEANSGNYRGAAVAMTVCGYLTDLSREEQILLGDLYMAIHVPLAATRYYEAALESRTSPEDFERLASACIAAHKPEQAGQVLDRALNAQPTAALWSLLGDLLYMDDDYQGALKAFRQSAALDEKKGRATLMAGYCALQLGRREEATAAFRKAALDPHHEKTARKLLDQMSFEGARQGP